MCVTGMCVCVLYEHTHFCTIEREKDKFSKTKNKLKKKTFSHPTQNPRYTKHRFNELFIDRTRAQPPIHH